MHKIITQKRLKILIVTAMLIAVGTCLCINFISSGDISVFSRAILV